MTKTSTSDNAAKPQTPTPAQGVVDLALTACDAYERDDLRARLQATKETLSARDAHVVVAGEFKQGKSSLVNALVGAAVCPVDDDIATAVPTFLRQGPAVRAEAIWAGAVDADTPAERSGEAVDLADLSDLVTEQRQLDREVTREVTAVNVWLPRKILTGMVLVDTPGVGGLGSAHNTPTMGALPLADAVVFVTDASQEFTRTELDFLSQANDACDHLVVALTKTDFYPRWRRILELNEGHLAGAGIRVDIIPLSAPVRDRALRAADRELSQQSGYPTLTSYLTTQVVQRAAADAERAAVAEVIAVCDLLESQSRAERAVAADPERAQAIVDELIDTKERTELLRSQAAKWSQTLTDGIADLVSNVEHDYRARTRGILAECDDAIDNSDPADTWTEFEPWLYQRVSYDVLENYTYLRDSAGTLSELVADHFRDASGAALDQLAIDNPMPVIGATKVGAGVDTDKMGLGTKGFTALRGSYMGILMFTMIGSMVGVALGPVVIGVGLVMGRKTLKDEKERRVAMRRVQAKNAARKYTDEVSFLVNKDSRDTLRRVQRQLRDHYSTRAQELHRSTTEALKAANTAAGELEAARTTRLAGIDAQLGRIGAVRRRADEVLAAGDGS